MKSASLAKVLATRLALAVLAVGGGAVSAVSTQSRDAAAPTALAWATCAGGIQGQTVLSVRRLAALNDKALVEADVARVFAQREKEQRVSAAKLARARLSIDFLYAAGDGPARVYYYEASKTIPDAEGLLRVLVSGWLRGDGAGRSLGSKSELQWLELAPDPEADKEIIPNPAPPPDPTAALVPQGVLAHAAGHAWVMRRAIGSGTVLVYDVGPGGVKLRPRSTAKGC